jgi:hypothetical protein
LRLRQLASSPSRTRNGITCTCFIAVSSRAYDSRPFAEFRSS